MVLICTPGNELAESLLPFFSSVDTLEHRVECDKLPLLSGIKDWTVCFTRIPTPLTPEALLPSEVLKLNFPWDIQVAARDVLQTLRHLLENPAPVSYPAEDALLYPRAMLAEGKRGGFLLAIPRPSNMKNFSITLQTGKGLKKESPVTENPGKKAVKIERDWMTRDEVADEDITANEQALIEGLRLMSAYRTPGGQRIWIITEADRSATTILLPEEY